MMAEPPDYLKGKLLSVADAGAIRIRELLGVKTFPPEGRGRPPKWNWECAATGTLGQIYRREVPWPQSQADVEVILANWFSVKYDREPGETSIKGHARLLWEEVWKGVNK